MDPASDRSADLERLRLLLEGLGYDARFAPGANATLVVSNDARSGLLLLELVGSVLGTPLEGARF
jgi:hypothetical protein